MYVDLKGIFSLSVHSYFNLRVDEVYIQQSLLLIWKSVWNSEMQTCMCLCVCLQVNLSMTFTINVHLCELKCEFDVSVNSWWKPMCTCAKWVDKFLFSFQCKFAVNLSHYKTIQENLKWVWNQLMILYAYFFVPYMVCYIIPINIYS